MFRSGIDLWGKTHILKVGLLASLALLRCQRSLNSLVKCTTSRLPVNCLWTHQKRTCLHINEAPGSRQGSSSHTYLSPWETHRLFLETADQGCFSFGSWWLLTFSRWGQMPRWSTAQRATLKERVRNHQEGQKCRLMIKKHILKNTVTFQ